jgi:hypothetical protein
MKPSHAAYLLPLLLAACSATASRETHVVLDPADEAQAVQQVLAQAADVAVNRLGQLDGFNADPRVRIPLPAELSPLGQGLRRLGMERYADEFVLAMNRAAEAAMPAAKPVVLETARTMAVTDAAGILNGGDDAATQYFRLHADGQLRERLRPLVAEATATADATAAYKRLLKKASVLGRSADVAQFDLDTYVTDRTLAGLYLQMANEEQRIRRDPRARSTDLLKKAFR